VQATLSQELKATSQELKATSQELKATENFAVPECRQDVIDLKN
jgi:hypothetical protein